MGTSFVHGDTSLFKITTPLGADKLLLKSFRGSEGISHHSPPVVSGQQRACRTGRGREWAPAGPGPGCRLE